MPDEVISLGLDADDFDKGMADARSSSDQWGKYVTAAAERVNGVFDKVNTKLGGLADKFSALADVKFPEPPAVAAWTSQVTTGVKAVDDLFDGLNTRVKTFGDKLKTINETGISWLDGLDDAGEKLGSSIGHWLGDKMGGSLGLVLGPIGEQIGTQLGGSVGNYLGQFLSEHIDFEAIKDNAIAFLDSLREPIENIAKWWGDVFDDAKQTFKDIKELVEGLGLGELLSGDLDTACAKLVDTFDAAVGKWEEFVARFVYKVLEAFDAVWEIVKVPLANIANFVQSILQRLGLVDAQTGKWGDTLLSIGNIGKSLLGALGYGLGWLMGLLKQIGGYVADYLIVPLMSFVETVLAVVSKLFKKMGELLPGLAGRTFEAGSNELKAWEEALKGSKEKLHKLAEDAKNTSKTDKGNDWQQQFEGFFEFGKKKTEEQRANKQAAQGPAIPEQKKADPLDVPSLSRIGSISALVEGSRDAVNAIAQARGGESVLEKVAAAGVRTADGIEALRGELAEARRVNQQILDRWNDLEVA